MTPSRSLAVGGLLLAFALVAALLLRGDGRTSYVLTFQDAGQLVRDNDVQVGGRRVGRVADIRLARDGQALVEVEVDPEFAPLHEGTTAVIRSTSLSGVANRYVALAPGPQTAPALAAGTVLGTDRTTAPVDLDQLFATLDAPTREGLQRLVQGSATQYEGRGRQANAGAEALAPALSATQGVAAELVRDQGALQELLLASARTVSALAAERDDLAGAVEGAARTADALGDENRALASALDRLPRTLRGGSAAFTDLRAALGDVDRLVAAGKPATRDLAPFLAELRPLVAAARPTIADLRGLLRADGAGNDLTDLLRRAPQLAARARPGLRSSRRALAEATPVLRQARPYTPDLVGLLRDFGQTTAGYDANGHYARVQPAFGAFRAGGTPDAPVLTPNAPAQRLDGYSFGNLRRCPGTAAGVLPDPALLEGVDCDRRDGVAP